MDKPDAPEAVDNNGGKFSSPLVVFFTVLGLAFILLVLNRFGLSGAGRLFRDYGAWLLLLVAAAPVFFFFWLMRRKKRAADLLLSKEERLASRVALAIMDLRDDAIEKRQAAALELAEIMNDHQEHHWKIVKALTAFVRTRARWSPAVEEIFVKSDVEAEITVPETLPDIQAAMKALGRRTLVETEPSTIDLSRTDLRGVDLWEANLRNANLSYVRLEGAGLGFANFTGAKLDFARFGRARLEGADLSGAAIFSADFREADMRNAIFRNTVGGKLMLRRADLTGTRFDHADLSGSDFAGARLENTRFIDTNLEGARLREAVLVRAQFTGARYNKNTQFPRGFDPSRYGMRDLSVEAEAARKDEERKRYEGSGY